MDYISQLEKILKTDVLVEVEDNIKELKEEIKKKKNKTLIDELNYMEQVHLYFKEVLIDIENKILTNDQALDILEGLEDMRIENQEI